MSDSGNGFDHDEYLQQLDRAIADVLPDDHPVHDRLDD